MLLTEDKERFVGREVVGEMDGVGEDADGGEAVKNTDGGSMGFSCPRQEKVFVPHGKC